VRDYLRAVTAAHDRYPFDLVAVRFLPLSHGHDTVGQPLLNLLVLLELRTRRETAPEARERQADGARRTP
jgi:hypothetical protein